MFFTDRLQDVDSGYMAKVDLGDRLSSICDEFNFLKALYDEVHKSIHLKILSKFQRYEIKGDMNSM